MLYCGGWELDLQYLRGAPVQGYDCYPQVVCSLYKSKHKYFNSRLRQVTVISSGRAMLQKMAVRIPWRTKGHFNLESRESPVEALLCPIFLRVVVLIMRLWKVCDVLSHQVFHVPWSISWVLGSHLLTKITLWHPMRFLPWVGPLPLVSTNSIH